MANEQTPFGWRLGLADFSAASLASMSANIVTHPFETLKVRQQLSRTETGSMLAVARSMIAKEGLQSLYRGLGAGLVRGMISGGGRLTIYNQLKLALLDERATDPFAIQRLLQRPEYAGVVRAGLGMTAGILAAMIAAPIDLARTRQQAAGLKQGTVAPGMLTILRQLLQQGGIRGLFTGTSAVFARQAVFTAAQLSTYDQSKKAIADLSDSAIDSYSTILLASLVSGVASTLATAPVEMVKTRMQMSTGTGFVSTCALTFRQEGLLSFWRGGTALYLKLAPHTLIVLVLTEQFRLLFGVPQVQ